MNELINNRENVRKKKERVFNNGIAETNQGNENT